VVVADRQRIERLQPLWVPLGLKLIAIDDCAGLDVPRAVSRAVQCPPHRCGDAGGGGRRDDHATIMYTSGSTGHPKGALSSHRGILSALYSWMLLGVAGKQVEPDAEPAPYPPAGLLTIPLFHCTAVTRRFCCR
jgi:long-chain acyl-CoA synthetase